MTTHAFDPAHPDKSHLPYITSAIPTSLVNGPPFSVVMATYNRGRHILPTIQSVIQQSFQHFELLIIGDRCTDDTEAVISPFLSERIRWRNQREHKGSQSSPNNAGIE